MILLGIDPGVTTGWAIWDARNGQLRGVNSLAIHEAMAAVKLQKDACIISGRELLVIYEDARQRKWFGNAGREQLQGAGSIKRDCGIWQEYLTELAIPYIAQAPVTGATKWTADYFRAVTGWKDRTNNHARDAAALVYGINLERARVLMETATREVSHG